MEQDVFDKTFRQNAGPRILYVHAGIQGCQAGDMRFLSRQLYRAIDDRNIDDELVMVQNFEGTEYLFYYFEFDRYNRGRNGMKAMITSFMSALTSHFYKDKDLELECSAGYLTRFKCWSLNDLITVFLRAQSSVFGRHINIMLGQIDQCDEEERQIFLQALLKRQRYNDLRTRLLITTTRADSSICELLPPESIISLENFSASLDESL